MQVIIYSLNMVTKAEEELNELRSALNYCQLSCEEILEDYREYIRRCKKKGESWDGVDRRIYFLEKCKFSSRLWHGTDRRS